MAKNVLYLKNNSKNNSSVTNRTGEVKFMVDSSLHTGACMHACIRVHAHHAQKENLNFFFKKINFQKKYFKYFFCHVRAHSAYLLARMLFYFIIFFPIFSFFFRCAIVVGIYVHWRQGVYFPPQIFNFRFFLWMRYILTKKNIKFLGDFLKI